MRRHKQASEAKENSDKSISSNLVVSLPIKKRRIDITDSASASASVVASGSSSGINGDSVVQEIDEVLHSRQLAVYGRETMRRLFASNVLISGMHGLGAEIAKNLILAGVKSVTLHDERVVDLWDLSSNFVFSEDDIGKNRANASVQKLQDLNNAVVVSSLTTSLTEEHLSAFQVVVFSDISLEKAIELNDYCHSHQPPIAFVHADVRGLFGSVFCDFGPEFAVLDVDGEEPHTGIIASISNENQAFISCVDDERLEFEDGDLVVFSEVEGMTELNDGKPRKIKSAQPYSFTLEEDTTNFGTYVKGGIVTQVKQPKLLNFKPLREALKDPGDFLFSDFSKFDRPPLLHLAFQALDRFISEAGRFPVAGSEEDAQKLISIATAINTGQGDLKVENVDHKLLRHFSFGAKAVLNPMAAMFGGIVGQEVVKACSGKFHPLFQFFYFDSVESLPTEPLNSSDFAPSNSRYDAQISVFGAKFQKKLGDAKVFTVGSGALGCEFLKNMALMGVSCGYRGKLTVTDDDIIEKSNLSPQFLFRDRNIGQAKSTVAASAAAAINPHFNIKALQNRVGAETENVLDYPFWDNLTVVVNALDNVNARLYVDSRVLSFQKPLLESGTLGAKCNTQMVIPHLTESYGASGDPPEKQAPMCTVHSFPHNIDHCLTWARSEFEGLFEKTPAEVNAYLYSPAEYTNSMMCAGDAQARDTLERIVECLDKEKCETFQDCLTWARLRFEDYFVNRVKQLIYTFPEYAATSTRAPFWSAPKRFPRPLQYSSSDPSFLNFITVTAILRAETFGIPVHQWTKNPKEAAEAVDRVIVPDFEPSKDAKIVTDEKATSLTTSSVDDAAVVNDLIAKLEQCRHNLAPDFRMKSIQFEKDDDTNYHMDVIAGLANMRARSYSIPEVDKLKAKLIAGRIIPAIATSKAMATGLVCLELYKVLDGGHKGEDYRNTFSNLALPLFSMAEPVLSKVQYPLIVPARYAARVDLGCALFGCSLVVSDVGSYYCCCQHANMAKTLASLKMAYTIVDGFCGSEEKDIRCVKALLNGLAEASVGIPVIHDEAIFTVPPWQWDFIDKNYLHGEADRSWVFFHTKTDPAFVFFKYNGQDVRWTSVNYYLHRFMISGTVVEVVSRMSYFRRKPKHSSKETKGPDECLGWSISEYSHRGMSLYCLTRFSIQNPIVFKTHRITLANLKLKQKQRGRKSSKEPSSSQPPKIKAQDLKKAKISDSSQKRKM